MMVVPFKILTLAVQRICSYLRRYLSKQI